MEIAMAGRDKTDLEDLTAHMLALSYVVGLMVEWVERKHPGFAEVAKSEFDSFLGEGVDPSEPPSRLLVLTREYVNDLFVPWEGLRQRLERPPTLRRRFLDWLEQD
jgi:hypothetical protein